MDKSSVNQSQMTLRDFLVVLFRRKAIILLTLLVVLIPVYVGMALKTPVYLAESKILIRGIKELDIPFQRDLTLTSEVIAFTQMDIVKSLPVLERVVWSLNLDKLPLDYEKQFASPIKRVLIDKNVEKLRERLSTYTSDRKKDMLFRMAINRLSGQVFVKAQKGKSLLFISVRDFSPVLAMRIANSLSRSYVIFDLEQQIAELKEVYGEKHASIIKLKRYVEDISKTLGGNPIPDMEAFGPATVKIIEQAKMPFEPVTISKNLILGVASVLSIILGIMLAFLFENLDHSIRSPRTIEKYFRIPCIGSIPTISSREKKIIPFGGMQSFIVGQAYEKIVSNICLLNKTKGVKLFLLANIGLNSEVNYIIASLGRILSDTEHSAVLIIDANFRSSSLAKAFDVDEHPGLNEIIDGSATFEETIHDLGNRLHMIPSSITNISPVALVESSKMKEILSMAKQRYEYILINCADFKIAADAVSLSSKCDGIIFILNDGKVRRQIFENVVTLLRGAETRLLGVIINNRKLYIPKLIYKFL